MACVGVTVIGIPNSKTYSPKSWKSEAVTLRRPSSSSSFVRIAKAKSEKSSSSSSHEEEEGSMKIRYEGTRRREKALTEMIEVKIKEAEMVCEEDKSSDLCKVAWDEVEEISEAKANLRLQLLHSGDPLHSFCQQHPETEECRIYHD